mgnify:CR=1 FL=1
MDDSNNLNNSSSSSSSSSSNKKMKNLEDKFIQKWDKYAGDFDNQLNDVWNFVMYKDFKDKEIREMHREIRFLKEDIELKNEKISDLEWDVSSYKRKANKLEKKSNKSKKRKSSNWFSQEKKKKPKNYAMLEEDGKDKVLRDIFSRLETIEDIIKLKDNNFRFNFMKNEKFKKIYLTIPSLEKLSKIIGMNKLKENVFKMICYFIHGLNGSGELNHCVITGPPGVGKTTVASILGNIYLNLGFLKNDNFIVARRSDLIGKYCGHTAVQTQKKIDEAEGGVLFIDEVYSLGNPSQRDVFTKECIDTINQNLTEKGDKFLCIIAGYKDDVEKCFFSYNKGLERRFPLRFIIDKYDHDELYKIFMKFVNEENWSLSRDAVTPNMIKEHIGLFKFYGGDMKTLFQNAKQSYSIRLMKEVIDLTPKDKILTKGDIKESINKIKESRKGKEIPDFVKNMYV